MAFVIFMAILPLTALNVKRKIDLMTNKSAGENVPETWHQIFLRYKECKTMDDKNAFLHKTVGELMKAFPKSYPDVQSAHNAFAEMLYYFSFLCETEIKE